MSVNGNPFQSFYYLHHDVYHEQEKYSRQIAGEDAIGTENLDHKKLLLTLTRTLTLILTLILALTLTLIPTLTLTLTLTLALTLALNLTLTITITGYGPALSVPPAHVQANGWTCMHE